jgi:hypothetical protein
MAMARIEIGVFSRHDLHTLTGRDISGACPRTCFNSASIEKCSLPSTPHTARDSTAGWVSCLPDLPWSCPAYPRKVDARPGPLKVPISDLNYCGFQDSIPPPDQDRGRKLGLHWGVTMPRQRNKENMDKTTVGSCVTFC